MTDKALAARLLDHFEHLLCDFRMQDGGIVERNGYPQRPFTVNAVTTLRAKMSEPVP